MHARDTHDAWDTHDARERLQYLVRDNFEFVLRSLRRFGVRPGDVEDLTQRVFLTAGRRLSEIRKEAERSFLFAVALREAGHARRSYKRRAEVSDDVIGDHSANSLRPDEAAVRKQALARAASALAAMQDELRVVFVLSELEELTAHEIGEVLQIPVGTAKSRLRRARRELKLRLGSFQDANA